MKKTLTLALLLFGMVLAGCGKKDKSDVEPEAKEIARKVDEKGIESVLFDVTQNKVQTGPGKSKPDTRGLIDTTSLALDIRTKQLQQVLVIKSNFS